MVVLGQPDRDLVVVNRRRLELVEDEWAKQPYHAAEALKSPEARDVVTRGIEAAHRIALRELREAVNQERQRKNEVAACAILVSDPMPNWSVEEILAVHIRMHKAEGVLFREALVRAANAAGLATISIHEKLLSKHAVSMLRAPASSLAQTLASLGKTIGPPWGKDQKDAALAAMVAMQTI